MSKPAPSLSTILAGFCLTLVLTVRIQAAEKPNILFIAIDDQNDWIGCLGGHPKVKTPHIDKLAERGTVFLNAHCQAPLCNPSRTSLMTGLRPSSTGVCGLSPWFRNLDEFKDVVTLPQYLKKHGYKTFTTGKIYHGRYGRKKTDTEFDVVGPPPGTPDEPFFMSVGFFLPHVPCYATQKWFDLYPDGKSLLPPIMRHDRDDTPRFSWYLHWKLPEPRFKFLEEAEQWENICRSYLACTSFVDSQVARVLAALEKSGKADNTIIVLWSDHGWHLGEKLITGKNTLWDDGTRVPLIFAGPGIASGGRCTKPAELLDMYPTLLELCDLPENKQLEGHSLVPQLKDANAEREWPAITTHNKGNHGIRSEDWRYITYADGTEELYDMRKDPNEWTNLAKNPKYAAVIAQHRKWIPKIDRKPAPGSSHRVLTFENGQVNWEGADVASDDPIPEL